MKFKVCEDTTIKEILEYAKQNCIHDEDWEYCIGCELQGVCNMGVLHWEVPQKKMYIDDFKEHFPNTDTYEIIDTIPACSVYPELKLNCTDIDDCTDCWKFIIREQ